MYRGKGKGEDVFRNQHGDTFHKDVPDEFVRKIFHVMSACPQHTFQVLTKRSGRMLALADQLNWTDNIWMGVSVESRAYLHRIEDLRRVPARIRFVMFEPLVGPLGNLNLDGVHWGIVGGENGNGANRFRAMDPGWVREIRDQCVSSGVKFVFKQCAGKRAEQLGRELDGRVWDERAN